MRRKRRKKTRGCFGFLAGAVLVMCLSAVILYMTGEDRKIGQKVKEAAEVFQVPFQEVTVQEEELAGKYYYQLLGDEEKEIYKEILQGAAESEKEIYIHSPDADRANELFQYVLKDFPDFFWCDGTATSTVYSGGDPYTVMEPAYSCEGEEKDSMADQIEASARECMAGISSEASDYEKILYVYEYIVNHVEYDLEAPDNQNIYSVFVNGRSVCAGYSKAAQYLLERLGVFCTYVTGTALGGQSHAWNLVLCDGEYYYLDTTWGDPVFLASEDSKEQYDNISYDYMCCDESELFKTHTPDPGMELPTCTSMKDNYYVVNGMYYESYDGKTALQKMNDAVSAGEESTVFKFSGSNVYRDAHDDIFQNQIQKAARNLAEKYGLSQVSYRYVDNPDLNKIIIYWNYK